ncbi:TVP38/TMEM64 family protein [Conexibacter woesei]|uniref:TVP38/TMEM64 family membrane protein n=1 Tax=Conexibacter woesei (strain DSM 14684 / CCUG 47730 / CIP 108061 / JCM 11494 / NBRC 100937 / ID131577) TaxID=469383 RepID=D3F6S0_CONWI|nr:VTT domain-containing protein [Conexibacter woesei]ADB52718.1 SNARE associated Golgi protein-related protein [Conexibacter woesei DSM 14684]
MAIRRLALLAVPAAIAFAAALLLPKSPSGLRDLLLGGQLGLLAPMIALVAWAVLTPALFPGTVLAGASGLAFGSLGGTALAWGGAVLGGLVAFVLARTVAREQVERVVLRRQKLARVSELLERRGFAATLAARLMPGVPATALHYAAGVSPVRAHAFLGAMAIGALLRTVPYALLGQGLGSGSPLLLALGGTSIVLGGLGGGVLVWQLRRQTSLSAS